MPNHSPLGKDKLKKAVQYFSELVDTHPEKSRLELLQKVELQFDLSPADCEFLNKHLAGKDPDIDGGT
jgi:hypothetical protein